MRAPVCFTALFLALVFSTVTGCGKGKTTDVKRVQVTGKVTLDGKPVPSGRIAFDPQNGEPPASFDILDGYYEGLAPVGKNKVKLSATMKTTYKEWKKTGDGPGYDEVIEVNTLPSRYSDGTITREVTAEGPNTFNFDCKPK